MGVSVNYQTGVLDSGPGTAYCGWGISSALNSDNTGESGNQLTHRTPGVISLMRAYVRTNSGGLGFTINLRKNGADAGPTITVAAFATGEVADGGGNTCTVAAGDTLNWKQTNSGSVTIVPTVTSVFTPTDSSVTLGALTNTRLADTTLSTASQNNFMGFGRAANAEETTEAVTQAILWYTCTAQNLCLMVASNGRSTATTVVTRKNGADGNLTFSIGASATGTFEDTSHSDSLASGDLYGLKATTGTGSGNLVIGPRRVDLISTTGEYYIGTGAPNTGGGIGAGLTQGWKPNAGSARDNTVNIELTDFQQEVTLSSSSLYVSANATTGSSSITLMLGASAQSHVITIGAGATGRFTTGDPGVLIAGTTTEWSYKIINGGGGSLTQRILSALASGPAAASVKPWWPYFSQQVAQMAGGQ